MIIKPIRHVVVIVANNENFSLDEQMQRAAGPFATLQEATAWAEKGEAETKADEDETENYSFHVLALEEP